MKLRILSPGNRMPEWVEAGYQDYARRFVPPFRLILCELPAEKRRSQTDLARLKHKEGEKLEATLNPQHRLVALDVRGDTWSTEKLADRLNTWQNTFPGVDFLVGGAEGLSTACLERAHDCWSLSTLTFPHPLVRIILAEQLYRATSLLRHHPYHRK